MHAGAVVLITGVALAIGVSVWWALAVWHRKRALTPRAFFLLMLVTGILLRLTYVFLTPVFYAPDEQSHFNYIKYLSEKRALPVLTTGMGDPANEWEYHQPPFYYLSLVPVYQIAQAFQSPSATVFSLRFCSFLLWLLNVWLGCTLIRRLEIKDHLLRLCPLAFACLLPTYTFISSTINNDNLLITMGAGVLCLMISPQHSLKNSVALGTLLGLGLLVKQSGVVFLPAVGLMFWFQAFRGLITWVAAFYHVAIILSLAALIYAPWAIRNWCIYGTFMPEGLSVVSKTWPSMLDGLLSAAHNLTKTFWSVSGISNDVGYPFPLFGMCFGLLALAGLFLGWRQNPNVLVRHLAAPKRPVFIAFGVAIVINVILVLRLGYMYGMGQGRHVFALLYPIAMLLALGLKTIPANNPSIHLVGFWVTYAITFTAFSLCRFPQ